MEEREFTIRERVAGYQELNRLELEERRKLSLDDRVRAFVSLMRVRRFWDSPSRDESQVWDRWAKIRAAYDKSDE